MLVEDLARAFSLVLQDYERFKIDDMFNIAQAALQNRSGNVQNYNVHANNVRGRASELLRESNYAAFPQRWKDLFEASRFAPASPERLGKLFLTALPADPQRAIPSSELNGDKDTYHNSRGSMNAFLGACSQVGIGPMVPDVSRAHFQLSFSELNYKKNMDATANILKHWSTAFSVLSRYALGRVEAIEIEYVGTTDLTFWLSTKYALVPAILIFYNQIWTR
jgi:hypothetical protein